ncbi:hypothetical protein WKW50_24565 [Ochrobactrum sp. GPK 3]|uniref:hypothetical protein n=1 Tax=Brucella sp. 22210 TaxID=3453892 RepID=UPI0031385BA7
MSWIDKLYDLGSSPTSKPYWPHGKMKAVLMYDYKKYRKMEEYNILKTLYSDYVDFFDEDIATDCLSKLTCNDKLVLIGEGGPFGFKGQSYRLAELDGPQYLYIAKKLYILGLRNIGVIQLNASFTGYGRFIHDLKEGLKIFGINFSYLCGPTASYNYSENGKGFVTVKLANVLTVPKINQYTILKGNVSKSFAGTRYQGNDDTGFTIEHF